MLQIVSGAIVPGAALPTEPELVQQFGVSRTVIREAMRILVAKGLVVVKHGSGVYAQQVEQWNHLDPLILLEQVRLGHNESLLDELLEGRRIVESDVAALAAVRRTSADLHALRAALQRMESAIDSPDTYIQWDLTFHQTILVAARNRVLQGMLHSLGPILKVGRSISAHQSGSLLESQRGHERIARAIERGDNELARATMLSHVVQFEDDIRASLRAGFDESILDAALHDAASQQSRPLSRVSGRRRVSPRAGRIQRG